MSYLRNDDSVVASLNFTFTNPDVAIAIDPVALVTTECITVTSAMRKHARWAHSSVSAILGGSSQRGTGPGSPLHRGPNSSSSLRTEVIRRQSGGLAAVELPTEDDSLASRWGFRGKKGKSMQDNPLMSAFSRLRSDLRGCKDIRTFDIPSLLHPFLQVIRSSSTSAPITSLALVAITKFFAYNLISRQSPRLALGMQLLSAAITHCRFEASDSAADEIVLLRILKLMEGMMSGPGGDLLGDESVCEMMETGLSMCCQVRLSELLRRSAEISMIAMCQVIFERLKHLEHEAGGDVMVMEAERDASTADVTMDGPLSGSNAASLSAIAAPKLRNSASSSTLDVHAPAKRLENGQSTASTPRPSTDTRDSLSTEPREARPSAEVAMLPTGSPKPDGRPVSGANGATDAIAPKETTTTAAEEDQVITPYSLPSIRELFRVLVDLLNPHDRQHTDAMRIMALRIIDVALEVAGPSIAKHPSLASLAKDSLCKNLFQLVRSDNMGLLHESLRVAGTLLSTCRSVLKLQQELFLSYLIACLHPRIEIPKEDGIDPELYEGVPQYPSLLKPPVSASGSGRSTPVPVKDRQKLGLEGSSRTPDAREAMVESLGALARLPGFLAELFVNYDCETDRGDLCGEMVSLLSRNAFPDSAIWSTTNVPPLCLDAMLCHIQFMADRLNDEPAYHGYPSPEKLREQRARKKHVVKGASKFNENAKSGIAYLVTKGIIESPDDTTSVVKFLRGTTRVSKKVLGDFLTKKGNERFLTAFLDRFDFAGKRVDEALRDMLSTFRLPGESALIERIVEGFCDKLQKDGAAEQINDKDSAYVLTYAIIMLNTDQHNPNASKGKKPMTVDDFARNLRGCNAGKDFDREYLQEIYDSIKNNEIILPDEHDNKHAFDYAWKELQQKPEIEMDLALCDTNVFDADMFEATWRPVVATLSYVFMSASEDAVYQRVVAGFDQCAQVAARYGCTEALDRIVFCLSKISTLAPQVPTKTKLNTEVQAGKKSVMVSELAVRFGRDYRAQLATVVLFKGVVARNENVLQHGWTHIVTIWLNLFRNSLIPAHFGAESRKLFEIPSIPIQSPSHVVNREERTQGAGLFSSFTSYLQSYAADEPPEPSDDELNDTLCTVDCISACPMEEIFTNLSLLQPASLTALVQALLERLPREHSPVVAVVKPEAGTPRANRANAAAASNYDPALVWVLEFVSILAIRNRTEIAVGKEVAEALQDIVRDSSVHPLVTSRAIFYLLNLLSATYEHSHIRAPVVLHALSSMDRMTAEKAALPILKGLGLCLKERTLRNELVNTPDFWSLIRNLQAFPKAADKIFELLMTILDDAPSAITADNYESAILLLNDFASAGSAGAAIEQKRERGPKGTGPTKQRPAQQPTSLTENDVVGRGVKAIATILALSSRVPALIEHSNLERSAAWSTYWSPIFGALRQQCTNPCREIRWQAFGGLQRTMLSPELASSDHREWTAIFAEVLFPLISQLMKPEVYHSDPVGMSETRVHAATLLCKIFLHYLVLLSEWDGMLDLWLRILDIMDRLMHSGQGDSLEEAVPESLKNILLVMHNGQVLVPPEMDSSKAQLWNETWARLDRFLPGMKTELFPESTGAAEPAETGIGGTAAGADGEKKEVKLEGKRDHSKKKSRAEGKDGKDGKVGKEEEAEKTKATDNSKVGDGEKGGEQ